MRPDKNYFSNVGQPYNFFDVSDKIESTCDE